MPHRSVLPDGCRDVSGCVCVEQVMLTWCECVDVFVGQQGAYVTGRARQWM